MTEDPAGGPASLPATSRLAPVVGHARGPAVNTVGDLAAHAGYRVAGLRDLAGVWRLTVRAERDHAGLLGRASRRLPTPVVHVLACVPIFGWLAARQVVYDPGGAALVALPIAGFRKRRLGEVVTVLSASVLVIGPFWASLALVGYVTRLGHVAVVAVWSVCVLGSYALWGRRRIKAKRDHERRVAAEMPSGGLAVHVGLYLGRPVVAGRMAAALRAACDRHGVTLLAQTTGEARIRLYRMYGFRVLGIEDPARPGVDARVFLVRDPVGHERTPTEPADTLWRRRAGHSSRWDDPLGADEAPRPSGPS